MWSKYTSKYTQLAVNTIRMLGVDAISRAQSGHPGIVLGAAPIMYALFRNHLIYNPENPGFFNRDHFVLSAGHGSALLYATMLLAGYEDINIEDLMNFRQLGSKTAGHPENILLKGVEVSTGPLGQGVAMAVGLAIAEKKLANEFNKSIKVIDHYTYCLFGDGCLEEGIFYEAINVAGNLGLNKLIMLYDSNKVQLDGRVSDSTRIKVRKLFKSARWNYIKVRNANNVAAISRAIELAKHSLKPTVIECQSTIGYGSRHADSNKCHGAPFTEEEVKEIRKNLKYNIPPFVIHENAKKDFELFKKRGKLAQQKFNRSINVLEAKNLALYQQLLSLTRNEFNFSLDWYANYQQKQKEATRNIFGEALQLYLENNPTFLTLIADLSSSTKIKHKKSLAITKNYFEPQNINIGVREFAMEAIGNGICAHGGCRAIGSTFLSFSDYCKPATRLGAVSHLPMCTVYSHDSITVGEDGPTHQPIEQLQMLRSIPNHYLFRPANFNECLGVIYMINKIKDRPISVATSRAAFNQANGSFTNTANGGYVIKEYENPVINIIATGSEVALAIAVAERLSKKNIKSVVISMPCLELFYEQSKSYKESILGNRPTVSIEYGSTTCWHKIADLTIGIDTFGMSGKPATVVDHFKLNETSISDKINKWYLNLKKTTKTTRR